MLLQIFYEVNPGGDRWLYVGAGITFGVDGTQDFQSVEIIVPAAEILHEPICLSLIHI